MGTRPNNHNTQKQLSSKTPRCSLCRQVYTPACDWNQGRCPHHVAAVDVGSIKFHLQRIINFFRK